MYRKRFYGKVFKWVGKAAYGLRFISLRYFNAAGAHVSGKIILAFLERIMIQKMEHV